VNDEILFKMRSRNSGIYHHRSRHSGTNKGMGMKYKVEVVQTNVFWLDDNDTEKELLDEDEAKRIVLEELIWDEDQRTPDSYKVIVEVQRLVQ
jgi:hypothetical protein